MGMTRRRRSRKKEEDQILSDYQMMALRLRLAEGFGEEAESVAEAHQMNMEKDNLQQQEERREIEEEEKRVEEERKRVEEEKRKEEEANKPLFENIDDLFDQLERDKNYDAWKSFYNLGCRSYRVPGHDKDIIEQQTIIEIILEKSVGILDWERCTLDANEIENLSRFLKAFYIRNKDFPHVKAALKMATTNNIRMYLAKIGAIEQNGEYHLCSKVYSKSDIVNMIRRTEKLSSLRQNPLSPVRRRRSGDEALLSELEQLSLRLWAILSDIPLTNMPEESMIGRAYRKNDDSMDEKTDHSSNDSCLDAKVSKENDDTVIEDSSTVASTDNMTTEAYMITIPPSPSVTQHSTEAKTNAEAPKKPKATMDSLAMLSETNNAPSRETSEKEMDDMELDDDENPGNDVIRESMAADSVTAITRDPIDTAFAEPEPTETSVQTEDEETIASNDTESIQSKTTAKSFAPIINPATKSVVQMGFEETIASNDTESIQSKDTANSFVPNFDATARAPLQMEEEKIVASNVTESIQSNDTSIAFAPKLLPMTGTVVETASHFASLLMQANGPSQYKEMTGDSTMTPSPKKKRRKSTKSKRSKDAFVSPRPTATTVGAEDFFTPKQDNTGFKTKFEPRKRKNSESSNSFSPRLSACKTASSYEEVCANRSDNNLIKTQHSFGATDDESGNLEHMNHSAELDFNMDTNLYSPLAAKATKQLKPDQPTYGSCQSPVQEPENPVTNFDLYTQQEEEGNSICTENADWYDNPIWMDPK
eukprot:CAMPEP_0116120316 /NCGR_PEP_ID=MMETSP0329-20121206/3111_1 /TAXON_ID=697910 /ORGANISM="Pseudo-nitzschia arenysensis, Strain B593" /LENGTH=763 /DNA_ID=CAMNT_0003614079 /DNA_START=154 /DNA_END=2445 /DNA_ORIENTATION=+